MIETGHTSDIAELVQLAVAPVFLLSGVGVTLGVLTNRLARIVDRARLAERELAGDKAEGGSMERHLLVAFLIEVRISTATLRIGGER